MIAPCRIQRRRTKGWRMLDGAIYVGRPTRWGNPFVVGEGTVSVAGPMRGADAGCYDPVEVRWYDLTLRDGITATEAVQLYRMGLVGSLEDGHPDFDELRTALAKLAGHDLVCWCPLDQPCHADVLLDLANAQPAGERSC